MQQAPRKPIPDDGCQQASERGKQDHRDLPDDVRLLLPQAVAKLLCQTITQLAGNDSLVEKGELGFAQLHRPKKDCLDSNGTNDFGEAGQAVEQAPRCRRKGLGRGRLPARFVGK